MTACNTNQGLRLTRTGGFMPQTVTGYLIYALILFGILFTFPAGAAPIQEQVSINKTTNIHNVSSSNSVSQAVRSYAQKISRVCPGNWEAYPCLQAVSESTLVMAANYAGALKNRGYTAAVEKIKNHCAAATAAREREFPAYAMKSAYTECANMIYDVTEETGLKPDQSHYQLLVGPILCMSDDWRCETLEDQMRAMVR